MPTRKQRKRMQKERRHDYETVWVDSEGNELEEPPEDTPARAPRDRKSQQQRQSQRQPRGTRTPLPPSWRRAAKRALILGVVIFALFSLFKSNGGKSAYASALFFAVLYTVLFIPFTYFVDRFAYGRWQRKMGERPTKR